MAKSEPCVVCGCPPGTRKGSCKLHCPCHDDIPRFDSNAVGLPLNTEIKVAHTKLALSAIQKARIAVALLPQWDSLTNNLKSELQSHLDKAQEMADQIADNYRRAKNLPVTTFWPKDEDAKSDNA